MKQIAEEYHRLTSDDRTRLQEELEAHKHQFKIEYEEALAALTPEQIRLENQWRTTQRANKKLSFSKKNLSCVALCLRLLFGMLMRG